MQFRKGIQIAALLAALAAMGSAAPTPQDTSALAARGEGYGSTTSYDGSYGHSYKPAPPVVLDFYGVPIPYVNGKLVDYDSKGYPIKYDSKGKPIKYGAPGNPKQYYPDGTPCKFDKYGKVIKYVPKVVKDCYGVPIPYVNGKLVDYDSKGFPIKYDSKGKPIEYGAPGNPKQYYPDGTPCKFDKYGKVIKYVPKVVKDCWGVPIPYVNGKLVDYDSKGYPIKYDSKGKPIEYGAPGNPKKYYPDGTPCKFDKYGKVIKYVPKVVKDSYGVPIPYVNGKLVDYDSKGYPIKYDSNKKPIKYGTPGNPTQYYPDGTPCKFDKYGKVIKYVPKVVKDSYGVPIPYVNGKLVDYDSKGYPIKYDSNKKPIKYGAPGNPKKYYPDGTPCKFDKYGKVIPYKPVASY